METEHIKTEPGESAAIMEGLILKPRSFKITDDPDTFLRTFKRLAKANGWKEGKQLGLLPALFSEVHEWLACELEEDASLKTVELMCKKIKERLVPAEKRRAYLHDFYEVKMKETDEPREVANMLRTLLAAAMPDLLPEAKEQMVAEQLPRVTPERWRLRVLDSEATTVEALIRKIERIKTTEQLKNDMAPSAPPSRRVQCFICQREGHKAAQCRNRQERRTFTPTEAAAAAPARSASGPVPTPAVVRCYNCGGQGHMARACPSPRRSREVRRLETSQPELKVPIAVNEVHTVGVVDTGSSVSLLREDEAASLGCSIKLLDDVHCVAANGTDVKVTGQVEVPVVLGGTQAVHQFHVARNLADPVLLGLDLLAKVEATIHCGTGEISVAGEKLPRFPSGHAVLTRHELKCPPRTESVFFIRRVARVDTLVFEPVEVDGVEVAPALYNSLPGQGVPVRVLNVKDEEVMIPSGTVLGQTQPAQEVMASGPTEGAEDEQEPGQPEDTCFKLPSVDHLQEEEKEQYQALLQEYRDVFSQTSDDIGDYKGDHQLVIDTEGARPIRQRPYRTPLHLRDLLKGKIDSLQEQGVIEDSSSPWSSPVVMIRKKDGGVRFCCDYRAVNTVIKHDSYPLPKIEDLLHATRGSRVFSVLDQRSAYWAVPIAPGSREVTAFVSEFGLKQWTRQPFGLKTSPGMFQRIMEDVLKDLNGKTAVVYLDDVVLYSVDLMEHLSALRELLQRFRLAGLKLHPDKCQVAVKRVNFLGHQLDETGIRPTEDKVETVKEWPRPNNVQEVRRFLGMVGYYRQYIPHFADKTVHLTNLLQKEARWEWTSECEEEFQNLKKDLQSYPVLQSPDPADDFILTTDASGSGWGAALSQSAGTVAFASGKWTPTERNWSVTERELGAVVKASSKFHHYLVGKPFLLRTDHEAIKYLQRSKSPSGRLFRWIEHLQQYDYTVEHVPGSLIPHVDALSRRFEMDSTKQQLRPTAPEFVPRGGVSVPPEVSLHRSSGEDTQKTAGKGDNDLETTRCVFNKDEPENLVAATRTDPVLRQLTLEDDNDRETTRGAVNVDDLGDLVAATRTDPVLRQLTRHLKDQQVRTDELTEDEQAELKFYIRLPGLRLHNSIILRSSKGHQRPQVIGQQISDSMRYNWLMMCRWQDMVE